LLKSFLSTEPSLVRVAILDATVDAYKHRIGRTGRAHRTGETFTFVAQGDEPLVCEIEKVLGKRIERRRLPGFNY
jgi:ATP-dependent RNA helicase RhlE